VTSPIDWELFPVAVVVGIGATVIMDLWGLLLRRVFNIPASNYCLVGRWLRHMADGVFKHASIAAAARKPAECAVGWIAHYTIGVLFALALASVAPGWLESPVPGPALVFGLVTVIFPFFIMHPGFGLGLAASRTPAPMQARLRSLMNHAVFGLGLYISAQIASSITGLL
jgi:hypothetical protein